MAEAAEVEIALGYCGHCACCVAHRNTAPEWMSHELQNQRVHFTDRVQQVLERVDATEAQFHERNVASERMQQRLEEMEAKDELLQKKIADLQSRLDAIESSQSEMCLGTGDEVVLGIEEEVYQMNVEGESAAVDRESKTFGKCDLSNEAIGRYSRQIILPSIGVKGQLALQDASVLVVGVGGLGCPALQYLCAAGVGHIGMVDYDDVEISNLQRQVLHRELSVNMSKVDSAIAELKRLNSTLDYTAHHLVLNSTNALSVLERYDVVLDCTDNVATRYLLNDACVLTGKPLISGSALRFEGQLTVYNLAGGPCYRCLYPSPPPVGAVTNCSDGGVVGAVTGVIGALQALEAVRVITTRAAAYSGKLLLYDGESGAFRSISLRKKKADCVACGTEPQIRELVDYEQFCGSPATDKDLKLSVLEQSERMSSQCYAEQYVQSDTKCLGSDTKHLLLDVRPEVEFEMCWLTGSVNFPIERLVRSEEKRELAKLIESRQTVVVVCRRGNDSQTAVRYIKRLLAEGGGDTTVDVRDIRGGLISWAKHVDSAFPVY